MEFISSSLTPVPRSSPRFPSLFRSIPVPWMLILSCFHLGRSHMYGDDDDDDDDEHEDRGCSCNRGSRMLFISLR